MTCFFYQKTTDSAFNLALEELLLRECKEEIFFLWQNSPSVIIGRNQNTLAEINSDFIRRNNIRVTRRNTGGGAVYHDLGNINYSYIVNYKDGDSIDFSTFAIPIIATLSQMGINAEFSGRNDILINGKKISGSAQSRIGSRILFHGTLLYDSNVDNLVQALNVSGVKISGKGIASVRSRVTNIKEHLKQELDVQSFIDELSKSLRKQFNTKEDFNVPFELLHKAETLADTKYRTLEWNYGNSPEFNYEKGAKFAGGHVTLYLNIKNTQIISAKFSGDFFSRSDASELEQALANSELSPGNIHNILQNFPVTEIFLNISPQEILSLFPQL